MTDRKMEMRRQGPPRKSVSVVSSMMSTLPWAGATMTLGSGGTRGLGSRKKQSAQNPKRTQKANNNPANAVTKVPIIAASRPMPVSASSATRVQKINFSAACMALPLCFMGAILGGGGTAWKEDVLICRGQSDRY